MDYIILFTVFILFACGNTKGLTIALILTVIRLIISIKGVATMNNDTHYLRK